MKVVLTTAPLKAAESLASSLIEARLAACVNVIPKVVSVYRWEGAVERAEEALLVIKTADDRVDELRERLAQLHPYDVPEIVVLDVLSSHAPYAAWVDNETRCPRPE